MTAQPEPEFTCCACGAQSYNPNDRINSYCGACHTFVKDRALGVWREGEVFGLRTRYFIQGPDCEIYLEPRPHYCDRGAWLAHVEARGALARDMDGQDAWPRYYFDLERAKLEIEAWMKKRGQWTR